MIDRVCLCLNVCDLWSSTNSQISPQFSCISTDTYGLLTDTRIAVSLFLQVLYIAVVLVMLASYRARFRTSFVFEVKNIFTRTPDRCNTPLLTLLLFQSNKRSSVRCHVLHWLQNASMNTECEYGDSQADPSFVSVTLGEFTAVKSMSCIFSLLNE